MNTDSSAAPKLRRIERTLSVFNQNIPDENVLFLEEQRLIINNMCAEGQLSAEQTCLILDEINHILKLADRESMAAAVSSSVKKLLDDMHIVSPPAP